MADSREVMNIRQAFAVLGVSPDTLYKYVGNKSFRRSSWATAGVSRNRDWTSGWKRKSSQMEVKSKKKTKAAAKAAGQS